jgi:hypothetical protein
MTHQTEYALDHKLAKLLVCILNTILFSIVFEIDHYIGFFFINATYFFGVNTVARLLEKILGHKKKHEVI